MLEIIIFIVGSGFIIKYILTTLDKIYGYNLKHNLWRSLFLTKKNDLFLLRRLLRFGRKIPPFCRCGGFVITNSFQYQSCGDCYLIYDSDNKILKKRGKELYDPPGNSAQKTVLITTNISNTWRVIVYEYEDCIIKISENVDAVFKTRKIV
jgi:hypothetical protein